MKNIIVLAFYLFIELTSFAQITFQKTIGGAQDDLGNAIQQTSDGGYIIAGETRSFGAGSRDALLVKLDSLGNTNWNKTYGGNSEDYALTMDQTTDGGFIFGAHTASFGQGGHDHYLVKTNAIGDTLWTRLYGGSAPDGIYSLHQTADGGYIMGGHTSSFGVGAHDFYLIKTNSLGDTLWTSTYGGTSSDNFRSVAVLELAGSPSYIIVGETSSFGTGAIDVLAARIDGNTGAILWSKTLGGLANDYAYGTYETSDTGIIMVGHTSSFGAGGMDVYLVKTDQNGNVQWSKTYGGSGNEFGYAVQQTKDNGFIIVGSTTSFGAGSKDVYLIKTDSIGNIMWTKTFGGNKSEEAWSVQQTIDGGYVLSGNTLSFGNGLKDIYVIKTDADGNSGCNQSTPNSLVNTITMIETTPTLLVRSGTIMNTSSTIVNTFNPINSTLCANPVGIGLLKSMKENVTVSPNPFNSFTQIEFEYKSGEYTFVLFIPSGRVMRKISKISEGQIYLEKNGLNEGIYFYQLRNEEYIVGFGKLIVE